MVVGLMFLVCVVGVMVVPFHVAQLARAAGRLDPGAGLSPLVYAGVPVGAALGVLAVLLPLRTGARSLRRMEF
jgi:ABC-2 type transport system permease protein